LAALFRQHGPPLVLKSDNGSAFIAADFEAVLTAWGVEQLFSPPRLPRYNGSCEAGIGSMKTRTHHEAARLGRPGEWTCDDAEAARLQANETARPWGRCGPTPGEVWQTRRPIGVAERLAFREAVARRAQQVRREHGYAPRERLDHAAQAAVYRVALRDVLQARGLLEIR
jgi:transposase InsO family protein